jgi:hypothetical protein
MITFNCSSLECLLRLCIALVNSKMECEHIVWNSIPSTYANKLECIQKWFVALCFNSVFSQDHYCYSFVYLGLKFCSPVLEIVGLRVPARHIRDFALFNVCSSCKNCPSARCASAANIVCRDVDVFDVRSVRLNRFLYYI